MDSSKGSPSMGYLLLPGKSRARACPCQVEKALRNDAGSPGACCHTSLLPGRVSIPTRIMRSMATRSRCVNEHSSPQDEIRSLPGF